MTRLNDHGTAHCLGLDPSIPSLWAVRDHIDPWAEAPGGIGEPATAVAAPAVANAIFAARCQHLRQLALKLV